ncbi:MAG: MerR family DNA-binding transcriptional regulator, partial [Candidatus Rokuibacteriota bacterium]
MEDGARLLRIGRLSKQTRCTVETIRYYERVGLLPTVARSPSRYRLCSAAQVRRLIFIRRA